MSRANSRVWRFVCLVALAGVLAASLAYLLLPSFDVGRAQLIAFVAIALLSGLLPLRFLRDGGQQGFNFEGAVLVGMLLTIPAGWIPSIMLGASVFTHLLRSPVDPRKLLFNPGKTAVEMAAAATVFVALAPPDVAPTDVRSILAVLAAAVVYEVVSAGLMAQLFQVLDGTPHRSTLKDVAAMSMVTFFGNTCFGLILAAVATIHVAFVLLSGVALAGLYLGYRGYARALGDRQRAEALGDMTHLLLDVPGQGNIDDRVLHHLAEMFGGDRATVLTRTTAGQYVARTITHGDIHEQRFDDLSRPGELATALARGRSGVMNLPVGPGETTEYLVAPLGGDEQAVGALLIADRRGFEPWGSADVTLLAAVANEIAVALDNVELFCQVEEERQRLQAESTKLNNILGAATDGIVSVLADGTIEAWNPGMARITGVGAEDAVGRPWHAVLRLKDAAERDVAPSGDLAALALEDEEAGASVAFQVLRVDGEWRRLQCTASPVLEPGGGRRGTVLVARDVTAEHEVEELKSDFIATVSHELRTPLTPLKGFLTTLKGAGATLTEDQRETVFRSMGSQLSRLEALIADLLTVAELDRGQQDLHTGPVQLAQLVPHAVDGEAGAQRDRCTVEVEDLVAQADAVAVVRIVRSLVSNALKHTDGPVHVVVDGDHEWARIAVSDQGPGIPRWNQQRIFGHFDRLGNHLHRTQGPGLGLTIARSLARRMGGDISLESDLGEGTTFTVRVPVARPRLVTQPTVSQPGA